MRAEVTFVELLLFYLLRSMAQNLDEIVVSRHLILKYPFMKDDIGNGYVSLCLYIRL